MRIAQFIDFKPSKISEQTFQMELWDQIWSKNSFNELVNQLSNNPIYWRLKKIISKNDQILEAGCGFGQWVWSLSSQGYNITGVDIASQTIKKLKRMFPELDVRVANVKNLPFKDENFDVYLSFGVVEHFKEGPQLVLLEANRVIKRGGLLFLTIPYLNFFRFLRFSVSSRSHGQFYQYLYSRGEIIKRIEEAGFRISKVTHYDFLSAVKKDFPFVGRLISTRKNVSLQKTQANSNGKQVNLIGPEPNFYLQKFLYKLDTYIILIEAHKK